MLATSVAGLMLVKSWLTPTDLWRGGALFFAWLAVCLFAVDRLRAAKERRDQLLSERDRALEQYERALGDDD